MDGFTEKKWFVYIGDHHEGPFSLEEIQGKMNHGQVSAENFVWKEGMADWKAMPEVTDFAQVLSAQRPKAPAKATNSSQQKAQQAPGLSSQTLYQLSPAPTAAAAPAPAPVAAGKTGPTQPVEVQKAPATSAREAKPEKERRSILPLFGKLAKVFLVVLVIVGLAFVGAQGYLTPFFTSPVLHGGLEKVSDFCRPYLLGLGEKVPALGKWVSPIPYLDDVSPDEYETLKTAAKGDLEKTGPRLALALSKSDNLAPAFYIASNLPDGAQFHVYVVGVADTLLNQLSFGSQAEITQKGKLGKSNVIRFSDGKPVPRGEYVVYVAPSETQPPEAKAIFASIQASPYKPPPELPKDTKILIFKTYFLGGNRDATYTSRLKDFHDKLREKADSELKDIEQFTITLENQLNSTATKFRILRKGKPTSKQRKDWETFHHKWMELENQLNQIFVKWTPDTIHKDYFYESLYQLTQQLGLAVGKVHEFHHSFFTGVGDSKTFDIQHGETLASAQSAVTVLKTKIDQGKKLSPTPNGMPRREGL